MSERTLIFHRATLPDDTVLLAPADPVSGHGHMSVTVVSRNGDGAYIGSHIRELDPYTVDRYEVGFGESTGQKNTRLLEITVHQAAATETIEVAPGGQITVAAVAVNEDGHRTQPYSYQTAVEGLDGIEVGAYTIRPTGRSHVVLGRIVGKQAAVNADGATVGWLPVYDHVQVPETGRAV